MTKQPVVLGNPFASSESVENHVRKGLTSVGYSDRKGRLHAKEVGFCSRQAVIASLRVGEDVFSAASSMYFRIGTTVHEACTEALEKQGVLLAREYRVQDVGFNMGGFVDAFALIDGRIALLEFKTCGKIPEVPKPDHYAQAVLYDAICGFDSQIVYFSRNVADFWGNLMVKAIPCSASEADKRAKLFNAAYASIAIKRRVLPPMPGFVSDKECGFCGFRKICWEKTEKAPVQSPSAKEHAEIVKEASAMVDELMSPEAVLQRQVAVVQWIAAKGVPNARDILATTEWAEYL